MKKNLPKKVCETCKKSFTWRKKWRNNWSEVKYCSVRCKNLKVPLWFLNMILFS